MHTEQQQLIADHLHRSWVTKGYSIDWNSPQGHVLTYGTIVPLAGAIEFLQSIDATHLIITTHNIYHIYVKIGDQSLMIAGPITLGGLGKLLYRIRNTLRFINSHIHPAISLCIAHEGTPTPCTPTECPEPHKEVSSLD